MEAAVRALIAETGAAGIKDMGKVMTGLRERHSGTIDLARAGAAVKQLLG
ncbi:MAG: GatB/YqeY domain-containing protein [Stellaceae bacterium]